MTDFIETGVVVEEESPVVVVVVVVAIVVRHGVISDLLGTGTGVVIVMDVVDIL